MVTRFPSSILKAYLALATDCARFYAAADDAKRRQCKQAFFTKIIIEEDLTIRTEYTGVYDTILDPANRLHADYWQRTRQLHPAVLGEDAITSRELNRTDVSISDMWWT